MSSGFSFPPPPPPPPRAVSPQYGTGPPAYGQSNDRSSRGGRGGRGGGGRGRGRGDNHRGRGFSQAGSGSSGRGGSGHSDGGARLNAQTPMTGIPQNQQYPRGYPLPQYPQVQQQQAYTQAQYNMPAATAAQYQASWYSAPNTTSQAQYGASPHSQSYHSYSTTAQSWPSVGSQPQSTPLVMGPPIRMGFDNSHPPDPPRPYSTKHDSPNPFPGNNKRKREPPTRGTHSTHQSHNSSFHNQRHHHNGKPDKAKAKVAPQVPNFGFALSTPQAAQPSADSTDKPKKKKRRKHNQLGLTPKGEEHEDSEDEIDEEAAFASAGGALQFTHNGLTSTLNTPTDLAAWIQERKNRFPTKARIEEKEKEKERRLAEARAARQEEAERRKKRHDEEIESQKKVKKEKDGESQDDEQQRKREKYLAKAEKLRRKLEKSERKAAALAAGSSTAKPDSPAHDPTQATAAAESPGLNRETVVKLEPQSGAVLEPVWADLAATVTDLGTESVTADFQLPNENPLPNGLPSAAPATLENMLALKNEPEQPKADLGLSYAASTSSDDDSEDSMSISSSSSDPSSDASDSDAPPTETSSRRTGPTKVPPPPRDGTRKPQQGTKVCRYFAKHGRCDLGARCGFRHDRGDKKSGRKERGGMKLFDRLVEQERKEEAELALSAIKYLGSNGFLE